MVTTKDLRELCQNVVTIEDLRKNYQNNANVANLEQILPPLLIDNLAPRFHSEHASQDLSICQTAYPDISQKQENRVQSAEEEQTSRDTEMKGTVFASPDRQCLIVSWHALLAWYLFAQPSLNALEILLSLEILSYLQ